MFREAIYHRPKDNYAYAADSSTIHIKLRTKKDDIDKVLFIHGDPFNWENGEWQTAKTKMDKKYSDHYYDFWIIAVQPPNKRLRYGFEVISGEEQITYTEKGFYDVARYDDIAYYFCFPFLHENDIFQAPNWVKDTVWYQIFPERFANGDESINPEGTKPWSSSEPTPTNFFGGDLEGILSKIDYIRNLGITGIYLTPIFKAYSNHKYDTIDYLEIDSQFGNKDTFKKFIATCHENGIKVMLDAVFNHSGYHFEPFQHVLINGENSRFKDWFHIDKFPISTDPLNYLTFAYEKTMPKLNTANPEVKAYLLKVATYWIKEFDIDGWRLDVANEIDHQFWREFRNAVKTIKKNIYIVGEIWHDSMPWLRGDQFDSVMNYPFSIAAIQYIAEEKLNSVEFTNLMTSTLMSYPQPVNDTLFNLIGSHDTPRVFTLCKGNKAKVKLLMLLLLSYPGTPCIYYGDEISMGGGSDPGCRKCMDWDPNNQDLELYQFIQKLTFFRHTIPVFGSKGDFEFIEADLENNTLLYKKTYENETIIFAIQNCAKEITIRIPFETPLKHVKNLWTNQSINYKENLYVHLKGYDFSIIHITS